MTKSLLAVSCLTFAFSGLTAFAYGQDFQVQEHCVAWKTETTTFMFSTKEVIGKNCAIQAKFHKAPSETKGTGYQLVLSIPLDQFDSGEPQRDKEVFELLRGELRPNLLVETDVMGYRDWQMFWKGEGKELKITLWIGEESYHLSLHPVVGEERIIGSTQTRFADFDVKRPRVLGGAIARVSENLDLLFHLQKSRIENRDWLMTQKDSANSE